MSTDTAAEAPKASTEAEKDSRQVMPFEQRVAILDHLRGLRSPIFAATKGDVAKQLTEALQFEISWGQIRYILDQLPKEDLARNLVIGDDADKNLTIRVIECEAELRKMKEQLEQYALAMHELTKRVVQPELALQA